MGFKQTSEGRVFFKGADNDDSPAPKSTKNTEPVITSDQTQMQILLLLKSLNAKLKETKQGSTDIKKELAEYKKMIKELEKKTNTQETNYIDLEQQVAKKNSEVSKKTERIELAAKESLKKAISTEEQVKDANKKLEEAKTLVTAIEEKFKGEGKTIEELKEQLNNARKNEEKLLTRQKVIEKQQKEYGEKMVNNVAAYVALTKRVSETETRQESLNNKIEEATAEFIKLDRKIDKALEDRARMLRKMERIENAVLETRDALNAKAMVLLTNQGAIGGVDIPKINDELLQTDPIALTRRMQEETLMPWWRRPIRIQAPALVTGMVVVLLAGWIIGELKFTSGDADIKIKHQSEKEIIPQVSLDQPREKILTEEKNFDYAETPAPEHVMTPEYKENIQQALNTQNDSTNISEGDELLTPPPENFETDQTPVQEAQETTSPDYGIKIHKGTMDTASAKASKSKSIDTIDIKNEDEMLAVLEKNPDELATKLNEIEPGSIPPQKEVNVQEVAAIDKTEKLIDTMEQSMKNTSSGNALLKSRIPPDPNLPEVAKKIEQKAYEGIPEAQHDMGAIYVTGHGTVKKDIKRAISWFEEASKNGVANAKYNLGVLYHQGVGVPADIDKAMSLYAQAADQNHPEAQYNLGIAYIEGIGVSYNPQKAAKYFENAANNGITEAAYNLGLIYENGLLGETRPDDALMWYKKSADKGSPEAKLALEQLAKSLGITLDDVNRIADRVKTSKQASSSPTYTQETVQQSPENQNIIAGIQSELLRRGLYSGTIDGKIGPMTTSAIRAFQTAANLDATGIPTEDLLRYMQAR